MVALTLYVFRVNEPELLGEVEPLGSGKLVSFLHVRIKFRRFARLHIDIDELNRVVLNDVAWIGIPAKHHFRCLFLPDELAEAFKVRLGEYQIAKDDRAVFGHGRLFDHVVGVGQQRWRDGRPIALAVLRLMTSSNFVGSDGDALLRDIIVRIRRHVIMSHDNALAIALWVMLSWVHDEVAVHSPILDVTSAEPECGKSTTLGLISFLMPRCISTVNITEAALYQSIKRWNPSFAIDAKGILNARGRVLQLVARRSFPQRLRVPPRAMPSPPQHRP